MSINIPLRFISELGSTLSDIGRVESQIRGLSAATRDAEGRLHDAQGRFVTGWKTIGENIQDVGKKMTATVTLPIVGGLALATKQAIDFDKAMTGVSRAANLEGDMDGGEFADMSKEIRKLAPKLGVLPTEFTELATEAAKLGVTKDRILGFTKTVGELGQIGDVTGGSLVDMTQDLAAIQTVTKANDDQLKRLGATANILDDQVGGTIQGIIKGVNKMSARATPLGIDVNTLAAYSSTMQALNLQVGQSSNAFDKLLTKLAAPATLSERAEEGLGKLGLTSEDVSQAMKQDAEGGLRMFLGRLNEIAKTDTQSALEGVSMFIGEEYGSEIFALALGIDKLDEALGYAGDKTQAFTKYQDELRKKQASTSGQLMIAKANLQSIGISLGLAILPSLNKILGVISPIAANFANFAADHPKIVMIGVAIAGVVAAIGPLVWIVGGAISAWATLSAGMGTASAIMGASVIPRLLSIGTSIGTAVIPALQSFIGLASGMAYPFLVAAAAIALTAANIYGYATNWSDVWLGIKQSGSDVMTFLTGILTREGWAAGWGLVTSLANGIIQAIPMAIQSTAQLAGAIRNYLPFSPAKEGALSDIDKSGGGLISTLISGIQSAAPSLNNALNSTLGGAIGGSPVAASGGGGGQVVVNFTVNMDGRSGGTGTNSNVLETLRPFAREIGEMVENALNKNRRGRY